MQIWTEIYKIDSTKCAIKNCTINLLKYYLILLIKDKINEIVQKLKFNHFFAKFFQHHVWLHFSCWNTLTIIPQYIWIDALKYAEKYKEKNRTICCHLDKKLIEMHLALNGIFRSICNFQMAVKNADLNQNF